MFQRILPQRTTRLPRQLPRPDSTARSVLIRQAAIQVVTIQLAARLASHSQYSSVTASFWCSQCVFDMPFKPKCSAFSSVSKLQALQICWRWAHTWSICFVPFGHCSEAQREFTIRQQGTEQRRCNAGAFGAVETSWKV